VTAAVVYYSKSGNTKALACISHRPSTRRRLSGFRLRERDEAASAESLGASATASADMAFSAALRSVGPSRTAAQDKPPQHRPRLVLSPAIGPSTPLRINGHEGSQALQPQPSPPLRDESR
jgi:hypothetical protein